MNKQLNTLEQKILNIICEELEAPEKGELTVYGVISILEDMNKHLERIALSQHAKIFCDR